MKTRVYGFDQKTANLWYSWPVLYIPVSSYSKLHREWTIFCRFFLWCWEGEQWCRYHADLQIWGPECMNLMQKPQVCDALDQCHTFRHSPMVNYTENWSFIVNSLDNVKTLDGPHGMDLHFRVHESDISDMPLMPAKFWPEMESPPHFQTNLTRVLDSGNL